jgi:hypothetical protein
MGAYGPVRLRRKSAIGNHYYGNFAARSALQIATLGSSRRANGALHGAEQPATEVVQEALGATLQVRVLGLVIDRLGAPLLLGRLERAPLLGAPASCRRLPRLQRCARALALGRKLSVRGLSQDIINSTELRAASSTPFENGACDGLHFTMKQQATVAPAYKPAVRRSGRRASVEAGAIVLQHGRPEGSAHCAARI